MNKLAETSKQDSKKQIVPQWMQAPLVNMDNAKELAYLLTQPEKMAEAFTGALALEAKDWKLMAGRFIQSGIKLQLLTQLGREIGKLREDGKIKEDYYATNSAHSSLYELLKFIDDEVPDEERFKAMKSIFLSSLTSEQTEKEKQAFYYMMLICKQLSSVEILILKACYEKWKIKPNTSSSHGTWVDEVAQYMGMGLPELVSANDEHLVQLGLLSGRQNSDRSGVVPGTYRLTNLGIRLCDEMMRF